MCRMQVMGRGEEGGGLTWQPGRLGAAGLAWRQPDHCTPASALPARPVALLTRLPPVMVAVY